MRLPAPSPDVMYRAVDGGAVLLSVRDEVYYGLNTVGSYIWEHLPPVLQTVDELMDALAARHPDVPEQTIRADVRELLDNLLINGLVHENHAPREAHQTAPPGLG
jgi:hypothetical protein